LTAKGYAPLAMDARRNRYDLHVDSSAIDLGLVQGFTTALTNVTGTVQAKVDVAGTENDPRPNGNVTIQRAAFTVEPTGVTYTNLEGRIDLQSDRVHIDEIRVLDNHQSPLSITGDLPIQEREDGAVAIAIKADDFKVIDNQMGNVRVNSDLRVVGQLNAPRIEGDLGVSTGAVNLDPIIAQVGASAYATKETEFATDADSQGQTTAGGAFDALYAYVHLTVPNDLVIKANDLKAPGSPIGLGALNVTLGGDVTVHKAPYDQPRIYGTVNTVRGSYDFQGRRFEILRDGTVKFEGTDDLDPALDLKTQRIIQAVTAIVNVRGTVKKPEIALSSTPPLEEADILSLIVFNQPINQLGEGQQASLAARAQGMALGAAAGQLTQSIGSALNLDTFELNMTPENGGGPQLTVGEQVGQNLFVKVQQGIGDLSQTNFILEYELTNWLRFRTNVLQGSSTQAQMFQRMQGSGADLLFFFSY
jgi:translocation and assembly module TamB